MSKIRTFVAVPLPENLKRDVDKLIVSLKPLAEGTTWVKATNLHFTLRFLGDIEASSIPMLKEKIATQIAELSSFAIRLAGLGCFPNIKRPRVIWLGATGEVEQMQFMAQKVEASCIEAGFGPGDKPFAPHLTIGRVKFPSGLDELMKKLNSTVFETDEFAVEKIVIYKSNLTPRGPIYTTMGEVKLNQES
jgi:RNA 2',3'-cyclic 3'-phosphodiesterase